MTMDAGAKKPIVVDKDAPVASSTETRAMPGPTAKESRSPLFGNTELPVQAAPEGGDWTKGMAHAGQRVSDPGSKPGDPTHRAWELDELLPQVADPAVRKQLQEQFGIMHQFFARIAASTGGVRGLFYRGPSGKEIENFNNASNWIRWTLVEQTDYTPTSRLKITLPRADLLAGLKLGRVGVSLALANLHVRGPNSEPISLRGADLRVRMDIASVGTHFNNADLVNADFTDAKVGKIDFGFSNLHGACFHHVDTRAANFGEAVAGVEFGPRGSRPRGP